MKFFRTLNNPLFAIFILLKVITVCGWANTSTTYQKSIDQNTCEQSTTDCTEIGKWQFALSAGVGTRTNPLLNGKDIPLVLLPEFSYYGENFFIENLEFGYTVIDTPSTMLNILVTPSYDRVFFSRWDLGNIFVDISTLAGSVESPTGIAADEATQLHGDELISRKFSILGGLEYSTQFNNSSLQLSLLSDLTNTHSGSEARFAFSQKIGTSITTTVGFTWKDKKLTNYYYGVNENEIIDDRAAYSANSSVNPFVRFSWLISKENNWRMSIDYQKLDSEISRSPLVDEDYSVTFFVGKRFEFD